MVLMKLKRILLCFLCVCFLLLGVSSAFTVQGETGQNLTVIYKDQNTAIVDCEFQIYHVASLNGDGQYHPTEPFRNYSLVFNQETIHRLAYTLEGYVAKDAISPTKIGVTNEWGSLVFENLPSGLYLVLANRHIQNDHAYETNPFIASLAGDPQEVQVFPKSEAEPPVPTDETACKVLKIWDDTGYEQYRPKEIHVDLLENGKVYDSVVLNEKNHWRYTWTGLNPTSRFVVVEKESKNYIPLIDFQGITYTITNQYVGKEDPPSSIPSTPTNPSPTPPEDLPQTGQLWWPVPVLLALGLIFVVFGLLARRKPHE